MHAPLVFLADIVTAAATTPVPSASHRVPPPMLSAPIPHLTPTAPTSPSPPSDITVSTDMTASPHTKRSKPSAPPVPTSHKRPFETTSSRVVRHRPNTWKTEAAVDADRDTDRDRDHDNTPADPDQDQQQEPDQDAQLEVESQLRVEKGKDGEDSQGQDQDKRAMRAERNRQSAAASRERKKRHVKQLEERVKYLTECNTSLQYRLEAEKQASDEKEAYFQQEISRLRLQLSRETAFRPQQHPLALHHLNVRGRVTY